MSTENLLEAEREMLAQVALGAPLEQMLDVLCECVESQLPGTMCSVLRLDDTGHLRTGGAGSVPKAFSQAIDGLAIGPHAGSCGSAAFRRELVVVNDISSDPLWADYAGLAASHGLRACWSTPIQDAHGTVLGTFAIYNRVPQPPGEADLKLLDRVALIAGVAIERYEAERERGLRKRAEEGESKFRDLFDSMPQLGWFARADGYIEFYNRGWYDYTGTTFEQMQGWGWRSVHDPAMLASVETKWKESIDSGKTFEMAFPLRRHDGVFRWFLTRVNPSRDAAGNIIRWVGINTDIDDQRRSEQQLQVLLKTEQAARQAAEQTLHFSELFVGMLGHDLRNPLSATLTAARHLLMRTDDERMTKPLRRIANSSERMSRMIDQLLDFTRVRIGGGLTVVRKPIHLGELCQRIIEELEGPSAHQRFRHQRVGDDLGNWDEDRLAQVISNLAGNARQHGGTQNPITVTIDGSAAEGVRLAIHNQGSIQGEFVPFLFDPFRKGARQDRAHSEGLGLGLFITQQIVLAHRGTIGVDSSQAHGTTFTVWLPR